MIKAACGYVTPFCCPVHAVSFSAYRCVAWAGTGNTSTSCSCSGTRTDSRGLSQTDPLFDHVIHQMHLAAG